MRETRTGNSGGALHDCGKSSDARGNPKHSLHFWNGFRPAVKISRAMDQEEEYDDYDDDDVQMEPAGSVVRKEFFEKIVSAQKPLKVVVPAEDNWRLVVTQVTSLKSLQAAGSFITYFVFRLVSVRKELRKVAELY